MARLAFLLDKLASTQHDLKETEFDRDQYFSRLQNMIAAAIRLETERDELQQIVDNIKAVPGPHQYGGGALYANRVQKALDRTNEKTDAAKPYMHTGQPPLPLR